MLDSMRTEDNRLLGAELTHSILGAAIAVHRELGPGLLENTYRVCLRRELQELDLLVHQEVPVPIAYKGVKIDCGYRADLVVENKVVLELKAVERLLPIHEAQLLTYLKLSKLRVGLLMNFNSLNFRHGLRRLVL